MARNPLIIQGQQTSLIAGNQLPEATASVRSPDFSGLKRASLAFLARRNRDQDEADAEQKKRQRLHDAAQGAANPQFNQPTDFFDDRFSTDYLNSQSAASFNLTVDNIQTDLTNHWTDIQNGDGTIDEKIAKMEAARDGALTGIADNYANPARAWADKQISGLRRSMAIQEKAKMDAALTKELSSSVEHSANAATQAILSGQDPLQHVEKIGRKLNELVDLKVITKEDAELKFTQYSNDIAAFGMQRDLIGAVRTGKVSPDDLITWAGAFETGADLTLHGRLPENGHPGLPDEYAEYNTDDMRMMIDDPAQRTKVAAGLTKFGRLFNTEKTKQEAQLGVIEFMRRDDRDAVAGLPSAQRKTANGMVEKELIDRGPEGMQVAANMAAKLGYMPPPLKNALIDNVKSGDPNRVALAIEAYEQIRTLEVKGVKRGQLLLQDMGEEGEFLDLVVTAAEYYGYDPANPAAADRLQQVIAAMSDPKNTMTLQDAITGHDFEKPASDKYEAKLTERYNKVFGTTFVDKRFKNQLNTAFRVHALLGQTDEGAAMSADEAFDGAWNLVMERYNANDRVNRVFARPTKGTAALRDPDGELFDFMMEKSEVLGQKHLVYGAKLGEENQWLALYMHEQIEDMIRDNEIGLDDPGIQALEGMLADNEVGALIRLEKVDPEQVEGEYFLTVNFGDGVQRIRDHNGVPLRLDPGAEKKRIQTLLQDKRKNDALTEAEGKQEWMDTSDLYLQLPPDERLRFREETPMFESDEELRRRLMEHMDPDLKKEVEGYEEQTMESINKSLNDQMVAYRELPSKLINAASSGLIDDFDELLKFGDMAFKDAMTALQNRYEEGYEPPVEEVMASPEFNRTLHGVFANREEAIKATSEPKGYGVEHTYAAVQLIEEVLPDGTGGLFMMRTAATESNFGKARNSFRSKGDRGIFQIHDSGNAAFNEVIRRANIPGDAVQVANQKLIDAGFMDVRIAKKDDLDKALVGAAFARLYYVASPKKIPQSLLGQAALWKKHYNTDAGAGTVQDFVMRSSRFRMPGTPKQAAKYNTGQIVDVRDGSRDPAHFLATTPALQLAARQLSTDLGYELKITPNGGKRHGHGGSQHNHGNAIDVNVMHLSNARKTEMIATAVENGFQAVGGYSAGDGKGTLHFDVRNGGKSEGGLALWWRHRPGKDSNWKTGPDWFIEGIQTGLMRRRAKREQSF